jgi:phage-related protein
MPQNYLSVQTTDRLDLDWSLNSIKKTRKIKAATLHEMYEPLANTLRRRASVACWNWTGPTDAAVISVRI